VHAVGSQGRHVWKVENASLTSFPELMMSYKIEKHDKNICTHMNFYVFQRQLYVGQMYCHVQGITKTQRAIMPMR